MSNLFKLYQQAGKASGKAHDATRKAYTEGDKAAIIACAEAIEAAYPVSKGEDGKDPNREARNGYLSALRVTLGRIGKSLPEPLKVTVKKVEGVWTVVETAIAAPTPDEAEAEGGSADADTGDAQPEEADAALWAAVELVTANLSNKAVRIAIADALKATLEEAAKV